MNTLLKKYGEPLCIHSLQGGYKVVLVKLKNGKFHCPIDRYSLDEIEDLKIEDYEGGIEQKFYFFPFLLVKY